MTNGPAKRACADCAAALRDSHPLVRVGFGAILLALALIAAFERW